MNEKTPETMTEVEKLRAGLPYNFYDPGVAAIKADAASLCHAFNLVDPADSEAQTAVIKKIFGSTGENCSVQQGFNCDNGKNIHVGENFFANYNLTILDIAEVRIGREVMIGPNTLITTVGHPISPRERRAKLAVAQPVTIGDDVWIGGNVTVLPGVTIGDNVVVAAGAVITKDVPSNSLVGGVPARLLRTIENDLGGKH